MLLGNAPAVNDLRLAQRVGVGDRGVLGTSKSAGIFCAIVFIGAALAACSGKSTAAAPLAEDAMSAAVKRLVPEGCKVSDVRFRGTESIVVTGTCALFETDPRLDRYSGAGVSAFGDALSQAGVKFEVVEAFAKKAGLEKFRWHLLNPKVVVRD
jgi:hypothetical protein